MRNKETVNNLRPAVIARGEKLGKLDEKTGSLVSAAEAYAENATALKDAARRNYEGSQASKWSLFSCCSGPAVLAQVAEARPAETESTAAAAPSRNLRAEAAYSVDRPRIPAIPTVELTKAEVDNICSNMGRIITEYDPGNNVARQRQLSTFEGILSTYEEKTRHLRDSAQIPKASYDQLHGDLMTLLTVVSEDHAQHGGLSLGGVKIGHQKSTLQKKLETCLDLLPEDGKAPRATLTAGR
jgi:hypothetical protein